MESTLTLGRSKEVSARALSSTDIDDVHTPPLPLLAWARALHPWSISHSLSPSFVLLIRRVVALCFAYHIGQTTDGDVENDEFALSLLSLAPSLPLLSVRLPRDEAVDFIDAENFLIHAISSPTSDRVTLYSLRMSLLYVSRMRRTLPPSTSALSPFEERFLCCVCDLHLRSSLPIKEAASIIIGPLLCLLSSSPFLSCPSSSSVTHEHASLDRTSFSSYFDFRSELLRRIESGEDEMTSEEASLLQAQCGCVTQKDVEHARILISPSVCDTLLSFLDDVTRTSSLAQSKFILSSFPRLLSHLPLPLLTSHSSAFAAPFSMLSSSDKNVRDTLVSCVRSFTHPPFTEESLSDVIRVISTVARVRPCMSNRRCYASTLLSLAAAGKAVRSEGYVEALLLIFFACLGSIPTSLPSLRSLCTDILHDFCVFHQSHAEKEEMCLPPREWMVQHFARSFYPALMQDFPSDSSAQNMPLPPIIAATAGSQGKHGAFLQSFYPPILTEYLSI